MSNVACSFVIHLTRTTGSFAFDTIKSIYKETDSTFQKIIQIADILNIDTATGYALDLIGRHVGVSRILPAAIAKNYFWWRDDASSLPFGVGEFYRRDDALSASVILNDSDYRFFIRAKIAKNYQTGTLENIVKSVQFVIGNNSNIIDSLNITMNLIININNLSSLILYAISKMDILVRPVGVLYNYTVLDHDTPFGFAHNADSCGFGVGKFVRLQRIETGIN